MNPVPAESSTWLFRRWWAAILVVFALQIAFVFALSEHELKAARVPAPGPSIYMTAGPLSESALLVNDPTLFARPHLHGFSGAAWLRTRERSFNAPDWSEPPFALGLRVEDLGRTFAQYVATNVQSWFSVVVKPPVDPGAPELFNPTEPMIVRSSLRVEGDLAARPLLSKHELPGWTNRTILPPTIVRLAVDAVGWTHTAAVMSGSGLREADQYALELARTARFQSVRREGPDQRVDVAGGLTWGSIVFHWQTLAAPETNAPPRGP